MPNASDGDHGLQHIESRYSVAETIERLEVTLKEKGIKIFARIDHAAEAESAGLIMRPTVVVIFGNPTGGTALMIAAPALAIDLPFKALAWQDAGGKVWLTYNKPGYLRDRHGFPEVLVKNLAGLVEMLASITR